MDQTEQQYIDELFDRLNRAEQQSTPRDASAERYIQQIVGRQPAAPYYMAQALIVQEEALKAAQRRIEELEQGTRGRPAAGGGSFLGGIFGGGGSTSVPAAGSVPRAGSGAGMGASRDGRDAAQDSPVARYGQSGRGGGFLAGAMQTAAGVAGGLVLGNMITGLLGGDDKGAAQAAEAPKAEEASADTNNAEQTQNDDAFSNVDNTNYDNDDSFLGGDDFGGGDMDI